jgi:class 3 adenylate cyclase
LVVVEASEDASHAPVAMGAPLPVAALMQRLAEPGTVLMSAATAARVQGLFISREIVLPPDLDSAVPTPLIQVLRESHAQSRFDVMRNQGLAPLVGREEEFGLLGRRWQHACLVLGLGILL